MTQRSRLIGATAGVPPRNSAVDGPSTAGVVRRESVLVVEDDPATSAAVVTILKLAGYAVAETSSVEEARLVWDQHRPEVALVDLDLGGEPGSAILEEEWVRRLDTAVILVTGSDDIGLADEAFANGAYGYVVKPYMPNELLMQVASALRRRRLERSVTEQVRELERKVVESTTGISELRTRLEGMASGSSLADEEVIKHLSSAVNLREDDTGRHIERVSVTAAALADWRGFVVDPTPAIRLAAALHDVGKIGIPDWVLLKPGRLSDDETMIMQRHCELGHALLSGSESAVLKLAASVALNHHERWDGDGYPNRRHGDDIPLEARITSVVDVFDALTRDRVYRAALPVDSAVDIMLRDRGGLFDPDLLDLFLDHLDDVMALTEDLPDSPSPRITRILVVGGERVMVAGLVRFINRRGEICVVGTEHTVADALEAVRSLRPDVLLTDYRLPDGDGARLTEQVLASYPETKVIVLTSHATPDVALRCVSAGCSGFIATTAAVDNVAMVIRRVHDGEVVIPEALLPEVVSALRRTGPRIGHDITPREREVLGHMAKGLSLPNIAAAMSITLNTARNHTQRVIEKLGAHSKLEAVVIATRERLEFELG